MCGQWKHHYRAGNSAGEKVRVVEDGNAANVTIEEVTEEDESPPLGTFARLKEVCLS